MKVSLFILTVFVTAVRMADAGEAVSSDAAEPSAAPVSPAEVAAAVERAHAVLWSKFIGEDGLIHDYVGELPTPADCALGRPNAIGWWSPIENGPMFTGSYLVAMCERARRSGSAAERDEARRLAKGLLRCASVSDVPGFIARGMGMDGKCHYPMGSQDQTHPWFYGLHAYATSGIPDAGERKTVVEKMNEVAGALEAADWKCPCDGAFKGQFRGDFKLFRHHGAVMYLFILRAMYHVTGDRVWLERYQKAMRERSEKSGKTRLEICAEGYPHDRRQIKNIDRGLLWIYVSSQGALARLADWETDEDVREQYRAGVAVNASGALAVIGAYKTFDNRDTKVFGHARWREAYPGWFPQMTQADAERIASTGDRAILGERKGYEAGRMRNPLAAAALIALGGDREGFEPVRQAICHYDYARLNMAEFFFAECAYYALPVEAKQAPGDAKDHVSAVSQNRKLCGKMSDARETVRSCFYDPQTSQFFTTEPSLLPSAEKIRRQDPNDCGYGTGMDDCPLFGGILLVAVCDQYDVTCNESLKTEAQSVFKGLALCATAHGIPGFVARGICPEDGKSIYITSSRDQYTHLIHALWRYNHSPLCDESAKRTIREILQAIADRMTRNVTPENNYGFLRADGTQDPRGICRMLHVRTHEAARLPMFYAAAWDVGGDEEHYRRYRKHLPQAIEQSLELPDLEPAEIARWIPPYAVLQMQCSLEVLHDLQLDPDMKSQIHEAMRRVAEFAAHGRALAARNRTPNDREVGETALAQLMFADLALTEAQKTSLAGAIMHAKYSVDPAAAYCLLGAYWKARLRGYFQP